MQHRAGLGAENAEGLVADLPAVAVRAVQEIPAPTLADAGDVRQLVADAGCDEDPPRRQHAATGEMHREPGFDLGDPIIDELDAVAGHLGAARGQ